MFERKGAVYLGYMVFSGFPSRMYAVLGGSCVESDMKHRCARADAGCCTGQDLHRWEI